MSLVTLLVVILVVGLLLYLINTYLPMDTRIKQFAVAIVILIAILWLLESIGLLPGVIRVR